MNIDAIGLGAVTVIDLHGFLARRSPYWTEATIRTHKVTKPLIWLGIMLAIIGGAILYSESPISGIILVHIISAVALVLNGAFLSFLVSHHLLRQEREGRSRELLPELLQRKIALSFIISFTLWWGNLFLLAWHIASAL